MPNKALLADKFPLRSKFATERDVRRLLLQGDGIGTTNSGISVNAGGTGGDG